MIKVFDNPQSAIEFAIGHNESNEEVMALRQEGVSHWTERDQVLFFPVLLLQRQTVTQCLELFHSDLEYEEPELTIVTENLAWLCSNYPDCHVLTIGRWSMELWIPATAGDPPHELIDRLTQLNKSIAASLGERWGRMGAVSPQPDRYYREKGVYKFGVQ